MKVKNMISSRGNAIANQFVITHEEHSVFNVGDDILEFYGCDVFQSYDSVIAIKAHCGGGVTLDRKKWDYSKTTGKYRNRFLGETKAETQNKIDSGEYDFGDLN